MSEEIGKGKAVQHLLENSAYDFILSVGDDKTDEEMFEALLNKEIAFTIRVGSGESYAKYRIDKVDSVVELLKQLSV
jgi:trehalose 6-phosphate synthase/phosphatase